MPLVTSLRIDRGPSSDGGASIEQGTNEACLAIEVRQARSHWVRVGPTAVVSMREGRCLHKSIVTRDERAREFWVVVLLCVTFAVGGLVGVWRTLYDALEQTAVGFMS